LKKENTWINEMVMGNRDFRENILFFSFLGDILQEIFEIKLTVGYFRAFHAKFIVKKIKGNLKGKIFFLCKNPI